MFSLLPDTSEIIFLPTKEQGYDPDLITALPLLDAYETERYHRYRVEHARNDFLQSRRIIKTVLADFLNIQPRDVLLSYTENKKPYLADYPELKFSLSHCSNAIVLAICSDNVGVDVELIDRGENIWRNAEDFINEYAASVIFSIDSSVHAMELFTLYWTAVESIVKLNDSNLMLEREKIALDIESFSSLEKLYSVNTLTFSDNFLYTLKVNSDSRMTLASKKSHLDIVVRRWLDPDNIERIDLVD